MPFNYHKNFKTPSALCIPVCGFWLVMISLKPIQTGGAFGAGGGGGGGGGGGFLGPPPPPPPPCEKVKQVQNVLSYDHQT